MRGIGKGCFRGVKYSMLADVIEYGAWKSGIRVQGLMVSATTAGQKFGSGMTSAIFGALMSLVGFAGTVTINAAQSQMLIGIYIIGNIIAWGGIGVLLGLVNALLVNRLRVPSIIITISTLNIFYGLLLWLSKGVWLYDFPPWFEKGVMLFKYTDADGYDYGLGLPLLTMIAVVLLTAFIMNFTTVGRKIYAMGGNRESASRVGFSVLRLQLFVYGYMGLMSGAAGVVQAWTVMTVAPDSLLGYELTVLAAVVLGGTSLIGGRGTLTGTLLGVILLAVMQNGLNLLGVSSYWQTLITGAIIVVSISVTAWSQHQNRSLL